MYFCSDRFLFDGNFQKIRNKHAACNFVSYIYVCFAVTDIDHCKLGSHGAHNTPESKFIISDDIVKYNANAQVTCTGNFINHFCSATQNLSGQVYHETHLPNLL